LLYAGVQDSPLYLLAAEIILVDRFVISIEIDLSLVHFLSRKNILEDSDHVAEHFALPGFSAHIHQKDEDLLGGDLVVCSRYDFIVPCGSVD
jgi:hypothetical protein